MSVNECKALILAQFIIHFQIIRRWTGGCGARVICKLTGGADMVDISDALMSPPLKIMSFDRVTKAKKVLENSPGRAVLFDIGNVDRHSKELIALCDSFTGVAGKQKVDHFAGFPLLYTDSSIMDDVRNGAFVISFDERFHVDKSEIINLAPHLVELDSVEQMANLYLDDVMTKMGRALIYAVCLMYPRLRQQARLDYFDDLIKTVEIMEEESYSEQEEIVAAFAHQVLSWWNDFGTQHLIRLPELDSEALGKMSDSMYFDDKSLYLSKEVFNNIIDVMMNTYTSYQILNALKEKGILKCFEKSTYMDKMRYLNIVGLTEKVRMYRLDKRILFDLASDNGIDLKERFL